MDQLKFYTHDPLASWLIDKLKLTPISLALWWTGIVLGVGFVASFASDALFSRPDQVGFFQDWIGWGWNLILTPVLAWSYLWGANVMARLIQGLRQSDVVDITEDDIHAALKKYQQRWRMFLSLGLGIMIGVSFYLTRPYFPGFATAFYPRITSSIIYFIDGYAMTVLILGLFINIRILEQILRDKEFRVNPLHADQCGGLKILSNYSLKTAYLVAIAGGIVIISEYRFFVEGLAQQQLWIHIVIPVYLIVASITFFKPLITAHNGMEEAKNKLLNDIASQFWQDYSLTHNKLSVEADTLKEEISKLEQLTAFYELTKRFPDWPLNLRTIYKFSSSVLSPIVVPVAIAVLVDLLKKLFLQ